MRSDLHENMMLSESHSIQLFSNEGDAENYVLSNPKAIATVVKNGVLISTFFGADYGFSK